MWLKTIQIMFRYLNLKLAAMGPKKYILHFPKKYSWTPSKTISMSAMCAAYDDVLLLSKVQTSS